MSENAAVETPTTPDPFNPTAGIATERVQADYFAFSETHKVQLPDGVTYVEIKSLNEGERRKYLNGMNRDVEIDRASGNAKMQMRPGDERFALLREAIVGWNLIMGGTPVTFNSAMKEQFLNQANPKIIDLIDKETRKLNAWLLEDMSLEDLLKERDNLDEMIETKRRESEGN